jgi:putative ATP-dependent endonuclease of the OLD family
MILENSIKVKNYKCFGEEPQGFEKIYPINIIIGKNNSGKSSLLDLIEFVTNPNSTILDDKRKEKESEVLISNIITEEEVRQAFPAGTSGGGIPANNYYEYGKEFIGSKIEYGLIKTGTRKIIKTEKDFVPQADSLFTTLVNCLKKSLSPNPVLRVNAERNILPEPSIKNELEMDASGVGVTNLIRLMLTKTKNDSSIIEKRLLNELNKIVNPELEFIDIDVQENDHAVWEVYLEDPENGKIPLSKMGSGIKTIIHVLLNLIVIPSIKSLKLSEYIFGFEELENNLHPSLQRKLFKYLAKYAEENNSIFFLTTHSSLVIDLFSQNPNAQILHVSKDEGSSLVTSVSSADSGLKILKDLGFKSSDLLLSNGIIWVEGPSDAIYLELLLRLFIEENEIDDLNSLSYTIQPLATAIWKYAGFSDAELNFNDENLQNKIISLSKINHNHLLVIDKDDNYEDKKPSEHETFENGTGKNKARLIYESMLFSNHSETDLENNFGDAKENRLFFWINNGTFETYLKHFIITKGKADFLKYFDKKESRGYFEKNRKGANSAISKVELAYQIAKFVDENVLTFLDIAPNNSRLFEKIERLYNTIKGWN